MNLEFSYLLKYLPNLLSHNIDLKLGEIETLHLKINKPISKSYVEVLLYPKVDTYLLDKL